MSLKPRGIGDAEGLAIRGGGTLIDGAADALAIDSATLLASPGGGGTVALTLADEVQLGQTLTLLDNTSATLLAFRTPVFLAGPSARLVGVDLAGTWTQASGSPDNPTAVFFRPTWTNTTGGDATLSSMRTLVHQPIYRPGIANTIIAGDTMLYYEPRFSLAGGATYLFAQATPIQIGTAVDSGCGLAARTGILMSAHTGSGTITTDVALDVAALRAVTGLALRSVGTSVQIHLAGQAKFGATGAPDTTAGNILELERTHILTGSVADGQAAGLVLDPGYITTPNSAATVTRHNYVKVENVSTATSAAVTHAPLFWFDANPGTHKAVDSHGGAGTPTLGTTAPVTGAPVAWLKVNLNGSIGRIAVWSGT